MNKKILFVGESPYSFTGNSNMMNALLSSVDSSKYDVCCFGAGESQIKGDAIFHSMPFTIIPAFKYGDFWGLLHLLEVISASNFDVLCMVGIDLWRYAPIYQDLINLRNQKGFKWIFIFPYEFEGYRKDIGRLVNTIDFPLVYSQYGEDILKPNHSHVNYFKPPLFGSDSFVSFSDSDRIIEKQKIFPQVANKFVFGFIGANQVRKDPMRVLEAFSIVNKKYPETALYLHLENQGPKGVYDITQAVIDLNFSQNTILMKKEGQVYSQTDLVRIYNSIDCLVNASYQEGLSWTVLEAMLCGCPVIASDTSAHPELLWDAGILVPRTDKVLLPIGSSQDLKVTYVSTKACNTELLSRAMEGMLVDEFRKSCRERGLEIGKEWLKGTSNINDYLEIACEKRPIEVIQRENIPGVLFAQKASAGDILMTTQCLKGLRELHPNETLHYMTSKKYMNILEGNPFINYIHEWDDSLPSKFQYYYNPHEQRILPGHWGRNSNSLLSDFYWKILKVKPSPIFIQPEELEESLKKEILSSDKPIMVIYSAGYDRPFREYQFMNVVTEYFKDKYTTVQMGGGTDYPAHAQIDFRGKLTYRQEAWVVGRASIGVTVDTFGAHLIGALGVSQVTLPGSSNSRVVQPKQFGGKLIVLDPDYVRVCKGLGPCSAQVRDCALPCIGSINPGQIIQAIEYLEKEGL